MVIIPAPGHATNDIILKSDLIASVGTATERRLNVTAFTPPPSP